VSDSETFQDPATLSYEQARDELSAIVTRLEEGTASLEQSLTLWERGEALTKRCSEWLDSAQARLEGGQNEDTTTASATPAPEQQRAEKPGPPPPPRPTSRQEPANRPSDPPW